MPLVASTIPNLVSGVSQQPAPSRLRTSGSAMTNAYPTVVSGLMKRPPTEFVSKLDAGLINLKDTTAVHAIDRDNDEKYILVAGEKGIALFDRLGNPQTITYPEGADYLPSDDIWRKLRFVTVADTTFILNTDKVVETVSPPEKVPEYARRAVVHVKAFEKNRDYAVHVDGELVGSYRFDAFSSETRELVAQKLSESFIANGRTNVVLTGATITFDLNDTEEPEVQNETIKRILSAHAETYVAAFKDGARPDPSTKGTVFIKQAVASVAYAVYVGDTLAGTMTTSANTEASNALEGTAEIARALASDMRNRGYSDAVAIGAAVSLGIPEGSKMRVDDEFGGRAMTVYTDTVQEFSDLPPSEIEGRLVKVAGNLDELANTEYWVSFSEGVWTEDVGYQAQRQLVASTMPHVLRKQPDGTFEFRPHDWNGREVGDDDSNPDPTFVGSKINGMFLYKGRLGLLSEENVILSAAAAFEDFYRTTVVQLLATDMIDVASATGRVSTLYHAAAFADELVLFSDKQQFRLASSTILSAETVGITNSTSYPCSIYVAPVTVGSSAFFIADGATHTLAREIFVAEGREALMGEDIAVQVPSYVPKNIRDITASSTADVCLLLSEDTPSELYVYKWYTSEGKKIQSAWCKWTFDPSKQILGTGFLDNYLYIVFKQGDELRMERMLVGPVIDKPFLLDGQFTDAECVETDGIYETPYSIPQSLTVTSNDTGAIIPTYIESDTKFLLLEPKPASGFTVGTDYEFRYEFSTQYLREETSDGEGSIQDGRLQMRYYSVIYTDTSYFEAHVTDANGVTSTSVFNGRVLADPDNITDVIPVDTGEFKFPIFAQNDGVKVELVSNMPYRCAFGSVEWSAVYRPKARRV